MRTKAHIFHNEDNNTFINFHNVEMVDTVPTGNSDDEQVKVYFASGREETYYFSVAHHLINAWRKYVQE